MEQETNTILPGTQEEKTPFGVIISIIIIVGLLGVGAFYSLKKVPSVAEEMNQAFTPETGAENDAVVSKLSAQGTSTSITDIKKDLNTTDLSNITAGLKDITF
ncbi:hypothetical protein AUJ77_01195 [Candidatus Nomurabacteria bacterium CG1_02_43_90]|uniref:Uncharacterized protein n=1 Tax=Candidatus Nomurabacteria bacterium CG1_02_43_90 TaxID=1805281 RepID=A0A1J4V185_9BACT|nr:MAG: hypothetical protein AUJ77_01195 [Candidatus Nomurabacteria bacterium CG1_02_43_90]